MTSQSWVDPRVVVKSSRIQGQGGYAREPIRQGEVLVILGGTVMTEAEFLQFATTATRYDAVQLDEDLHLVDLSPTSRDTNGSLNHSCDSNLWMRDEVTLIARRDIEQGEEITVDYALFTTVPDWKMECQCGSPLCRHVITGDDWRNSEVQQRYQDHFSPYINRRIAAQRMRQP